MVSPLNTEADWYPGDSQKKTEEEMEEKGMGNECLTSERQSHWEWYSLHEMVGWAWHRTGDRPELVREQWAGEEVISHWAGEEATRCWADE